MRATVLAVKRARDLRRAMTKPEVMLWAKLRVRQPGVPSFRRQHPFGVYILDFFCPTAALVVEIDGMVHGEAEKVAHDARRDAWLRAQCLTIFRIPAINVLGNLDETADGIRVMAFELAGAGRPPSSTVARSAYGGGGPRSGGGGE